MLTTKHNQHFKSFISNNVPKHLQNGAEEILSATLNMAYAYSKANNVPVDAALIHKCKEEVLEKRAKQHALDLNNEARAEIKKMLEAN